MTAIKIIGISILAIILISVVVGYLYVKNITNNIKIDIIKGFRGINLSSFSLEDLLFTGQTKINPQLAIEIINNTSSDIQFKEMEANLYYQGTLIGNTSQDLYKKFFKVCGKHDPSTSKYQDCPINHSTIADYVNVYLNSSGVQLLSDKKKGLKPELNYRIKAKVQLFGMWVPVSYEDKFTW